MRRSGYFLSFVCAAAACLAAGAARADFGYEDPSEEWMPPNINWQKATEIVVRLGDYDFAPDQITFKKGQPYKLILDNVGKRPHDLVEIGFFHSIVIHRIHTGGAIINTPHVHSLYQHPGNRLEMQFVPLKTGEFNIFCSLSGHKDEGMEGFFAIED